MQLASDLAQRIVTVAMAIVHRNVNLMDARGIIIASGHPRRIGTLHTGAKRAAETGETVEIFPDEVPRYPGALEGINMPIMGDGKVLAVVGVYGDPPSSREMARLVRMIAEHILERESQYREADTQTRLREEFLGYLTDHRGGEVPAAAQHLALSLGFDLAPHRFVVMASVGIDSGDVPFPAEYRPPMLVVSRLIEVESLLRGKALLRGADFLGTIDRRLAILFQGADDMAAGSGFRRTEAMQRELSDFLDLPVICGTGGLASSGELPISRRQAEFALARCSPRRRSRSIHDQDILLPYLRASGMTRDGEIAAAPLSRKLAKLFSGKPQLKETIAALIEENQDCSAAALRLGLHRNTLAYRLDQFAQATGLKPLHHMDDAILCWFLVVSTSESLTLLSAPRGVQGRPRQKKG
jgi:carbohydrate diacid regulator